MGITEEILIRFLGKDETKSAVNSVKSNVKQLEAQSTKTTKQVSDVAKKSADSTTKSSNNMKQAFSKLDGVFSTMGGLVGYDIASGLVEAGRQAINASQQFDYFAGRLGKSAQDTQQFKDGINDLQKEFKKVNMQSVGSTAMEIAVKNGLQGTNEELLGISRMTAVMSSTFKKEGRTEEDAILAVNDALDGQFRRLQEIGIKQEDLKKNGWNGDLNDKMGLVNALNKTMQDMGLEQTAKDITSLDDAWSALTVAGSRLIESVLIPMMPAIMSVLNGLTNMVSGFNQMPDWFKNLASYGIMAGAGILTVAYAANKLSGVLGTLKGFGGIFGKIFSTGGAAGGASSGAAGQGIVSAIKGLGKIGDALMSSMPGILKLAAAVAVIIALIFALAAEVIVLTKGIQMLIDSMDFGGIDISDDIDGLKKLSQAMWEIGYILAGMALANSANVIVNVTGGIVTLANGLNTIKDAYKKVADAVNELKNMGDIDQGGLDKLKKLGEAMESIGKVALGLSAVNGSMNIGQAINDFVAWLTGGDADIGNNITALINKVREIAPKLEELKTLPDIDQSGVEKIKKIGDALKSIGDAATSMGGVQGGFVGGFMDLWQGSLQDQIDKAIQVIKDVAPKLQELGGINIPDLSGVQRVAVGLSYIKSASQQMTQFVGFEIPEDVPERVGRAVEMVKQVAAQLQGLGGTSVGDVATIVGQIQSAIEQIKGALSAANFNAEGVNIGNSLTSGVQSGLSGLPGVVNDASNNAVNTARGTLTSGMQSVGSDSVNSFRSGIEGMSDAMSSEMEQVQQAVQSGLDAAKQKASGGAAEILAAFKGGLGINSPGYMYWAMFGEMGRLNDLLSTSAAPLSNAAYNLGSRITDNFNPNMGLNTGLSSNAISEASGTGNTYYIGEGAFTVVVKDMTTKECQGIITEALESL